MIDWTGHPPFGREVSLKHTLEILHAKEILRIGRLPLIVEIGTSESYNPNGLGNALLAFAWYAWYYGAVVKSVDVRQGAVQNSREILETYLYKGAQTRQCVPTVVWADAYEWVATLHEPIDLLYVDAGYELIGDPNYTAFIKRHPEIPSFYVELFCQFDPSCFQPGALMLFDDTDPDTFNGKGVFLIPKLLSEGWRKVDMQGVLVFPMVLLEKVA